MKKIPNEIVTALKNLEQKKTLTADQVVKLDTFLQGLESAIVNPANNSKILVNPIPREPDVSIRAERSLEDRIKHINTVSARVRQMMQPEPEEEQNDFDSIDDSFDMLPRSIFEIKDHELEPFVEEKLEPIKEDPPPDEPTENPPDEPVE